MFPVSRWNFHIGSIPGYKGVLRRIGNTYIDPEPCTFLWPLTKIIVLKAKFVGYIANLIYFKHIQFISRFYWISCFLPAIVPLCFESVPRSDDDRGVEGTHLTRKTLECKRDYFVMIRSTYHANSYCVCIFQVYQIAFSLYFRLLGEVCIAFSETNSIWTKKRK